MKSTKLRILVIDDNENVAKLIAKTLNYLGHDAKPRLDAESGLIFAKKYNPHIAFIDIGLPKMNGYELARKIRQSKSDSLQKIKLVALTGHGQEDKHLSRSNGFDVHLVKPVDIETLKRTVLELNQ